jgi:hypothetical protein
MRRQTPPLVRLLRDPARSLTQLAHRILDHLGQHTAAVVVVGVLVAVTAVASIAFRRWQERVGVRDGRVLCVAVPPEVDVEQARLLWAGLHDLLRPRWRRRLHGQPQLAWEIVGSAAGIEFRLWLPEAVPPGLAERAIEAAWPGTTIREIDRPSFLSGHVVEASQLVLSGRECFPLGAIGDDPLRLLLGQLAASEAGIESTVQVVCRPATIRERGRLQATARRIRNGIPDSRLLRLLDLFAPAERRRPVDPTVAPDVRDVLAKAAQPLFRVAIRVAVGAPSRPVARGRIHGVLGAFAAYEGRVGLRRRRLRHPLTQFEERRLGRHSFLLSLHELAALCHLPAEPALPGLIRAGSRAVAAPPGLAHAGKPLGLDNSGRQVALDPADARYHLHVVGPTGVGKSTLLAQLALADLEAGRGAAVIDPKGDLVEELLARIPSGMDERVDLLDPLDPAPPGLNVLEGADRDLVVDQLVGIFQRVYERFWGPRTDDILRASLLTLMNGDEQATLADVPRLLADDAWRRQLTATLDDPVGLEPFWAWYDQLGDSMRAQATGPVLNKLRAFLLRRPVRAIVGQPASTIDVGRSLDQGRLLLARVPKGTLGEETSRLLGSFVVARVWQAALARASRPEQHRPDASLYIDEVHNYLSLPTPLAEMLAEARGYRLSLCLAHQHLGQLPKEMREALSANARNKIYFQLSPEDGQALERLVKPELAAHDLAHLPVYTAAVRLCRAGEPTPAFTLTTQPLPDGSSQRAVEVREDSRRRNGRAATAVDAQLAQRHRRTLTSGSPQTLSGERGRRDTREAA